MITVGVCGFGFTGSGAVVDLLKDYEVAVYDAMESGIVYNPDGLADLKRAICHPYRFMSSDAAIARFIHLAKRTEMNYKKCYRKDYLNIVNTFLNEVDQIRWKGYNSNYWHLSHGLDFWLVQNLGSRIRRRLEMYFGRINMHTFPERVMHYSYMSEEDFNQAAKTFLCGLIELIQGPIEKEILVLDQPFPANDPKSVFDFFETPKAIIVHRDPRDLFLLAKKEFKYDARFIPSDRVEDFICFYRGQMNSCRYNPKDNDILDLKFEDLIYDNENTEKKIEAFLDVKKKKTERKHFDPNISINNTQVWLKYPKYQNDIRKIENELGSYCFDFSKYSKKPSFNINVDFLYK